LLLAKSCEAVGLNIEFSEHFSLISRRYKSMINQLKKLAPLGKSMFYMGLIFAFLFVVFPLYRSQPIDFEAVIGCLLLSGFWWLLGMWHENETKDRQ